MAQAAKRTNREAGRTRRDCFQAMLAVLLLGVGACSGNDKAPDATGSPGSPAAAVARAQAAPLQCPPTGPKLSIRVCGNRLVDNAGNTVQLRGVNLAGIDNVAIFGWSPDNPWGGDTGTPTPDWKAIKTWGVNSVRILLNEASWLGLTCVDYGGVGSVVTNGVKVNDTPGRRIKADPGGNYQSTILTAVQEATAAGIYVMVDLHLSAPGDACPTTQNAMADLDHSIDFWTSVATALKDYPSVMFELFNEPFLDATPLIEGKPWPVLLEGKGTLGAFLTGGNPSIVKVSWQSAGMQQMLDAVRATGATNVVLTSTLAYSSMMDGWLKYHPNDTLKPSQIAAVWHAYPDARYPTQENCIGLPACSARNRAAVQEILAAGYPVVITEFGDKIGGTTSPMAASLLPFADANGIGYLAFCWDTWGAPANVLITNGAGDPTPGYGTYVKAHFLCRAAGKTDCP